MKEQLNNTLPPPIKSIMCACIVEAKMYYVDMVVKEKHTVLIYNQVLSQLRIFYNHVHLLPLCNQLIKITVIQSKILQTCSSVAFVQSSNLSILMARRKDYSNTVKISVLLINIDGKEIRLQ